MSSLDEKRPAGENSAESRKESSEHHHHHSHHHHSSRHHHHSHHHSRSHGKSKLSKFIKKNRQLLTNIALLVVSLGLVAALAVLADLYSKTERFDSDQGGSAQSDPVQSDPVDQQGASVMRVEVPYFSGDVPLVVSEVQKYAQRELSESAKEALDRLNPGNQRLDIGLPVELRFDISGVPAGCLVVSASVEVSENPDFSNPTIYTLRTGEQSVLVRHLKTGTQYYYRIRYTMSDGNVGAVQSSFKTANTPRILSVDGIVNVRDIGGWRTTDGKRIRQGLLYRGSELDGAVKAEYCLTDEGRHDMLAVFGIRTDMDLRASTDNVYGTDALGANVEHIYYSAADYVNVFTDYGRETVRKVFSDLADESKYPVYLHCTYGVDRTGTMCYLLEALLGVKKEDLQREYELSGLYSGYVAEDYLSDFVAELEKLEGATMQQKVENFLLSTGVTEAEIASIREIFLEQ